MALADLFSRELRESDVLARFGGEEFVLVLPGTGLEDAGRLLARLRRRVEESAVEFDGDRIGVTISAGITEWGPEEPLETALQRADGLLYASKAAGRNCLRSGPAGDG